MANGFTSITSFKFVCETCDFKCSKRGDYTRHISTPKHKRIANAKNDYAIFTSITSDNKFGCLCGKSYKHQTSLCKHKKKCTHIAETIPTTDFKTMFLEVMEKNNELVKTIAEMAPKMGNNNNNNNTTNNVKQKFNINMFLNEKCKDAISMDQFIDKIEISMKNLLTTKDKGLGTGLSNIIIDNMEQLSLYERPMHCTDKKRETLYVKNDKWEKDEKLENINNLLKKIEKKQMKSIDKWTDEHPDYLDKEHLQEEYLKLIRNCTSSMGDCKEKVIKNVCDNVHVPE